MASASSAADARAKAVQAALQRQTAPNPPPSALSPSSAVSPRSPPMSPSAATSTDPLRSLIIFVVGAPGAGKTTQCAALASLHSFHHVQFDDFLRQSLVYADTKVNKKPQKRSSRRSSTFVPSLSTSHLQTLTRHHQSKQILPSSIRCRILYSAMQYLSEREPLFRFLVDGYLESEEDWNEWAALVKKRQAEKEAKAGAGGLSPSSTIGFLPPIIIRLVCSESIGQLRWRKQLLAGHDAAPTSPSSGAPTASDVKARSMKYSLKTRPMIYRLGLVTQEQKRRRGGEEKGDREDDEGSDSEDDDPDHLAVMAGMVIKRVDAEVDIAGCYADMEALVQQILDLTQDKDWTRLTGYESDEDERVAPLLTAASTRANPVVTVRPVSTAVPSVNSSVVSTPALTVSTASTLAPPAAAAEPDTDSPREINWQEDPTEASEREALEKEELDRLERTQRMLRLIDAEEARWREQQEKEEERERRKMDEEIRRIQEREELVEAEQGHIRTRRDDRFVTFISTVVAVSISQGVKEGEGQVWVEVYRGFERTDKPGEMRWLRVNSTAKLPVTSVNIAFPRVIVNTWKLSGNERERPVMFRLFHSILPDKPTANPPPPTLIGESRTMLQHLLAPPEDKGLTLTLRKTTMPQPMGYLLVSPASLHTLLKPNKIIPPHRLHTVMAERVIIPAQIPLTPHTAPASAASPTGKDAPEEKSADKAAKPTSPSDAKATGPTDPKEKERKERRREKEGKGRPRSNSDKGDRKERDPKDEEEMEKILREMDEQVTVGQQRPQSGRTSGAASPAKGSEEAKAAAPRLSLVEHARAALGRLSIGSPRVGTRVKGTRESRHEKQRRELLEGRKQKRKEDAKELHRRAASRERRRRELARIKKKAQVQKVSALTVDCAASHLPKQGLFTEGRFYLQVYRKRDKGKERERAIKLARAAKTKAKSNLAPSVKLPDEFPPDSRNWCVHPTHRHLLKPSLFSLVFSSPVQAGLNPSFAPFLLPLDDQPLLFVLVAATCPHPHDVVNARMVEHEGKDKIVGMVRLTVEDVVKMAIIQQREWEVDVYAMVEREKEKERLGQAEQWREDEQGEERERAASEKDRVSVLLKDPKVLEKEREVRRAKREAKRNKAGLQPIPVGGAVAGDDSSDDDDSGGEEEGGGQVQMGNSVPMLSFFSLAFYTTRPVMKEEMGLVNDFTVDVRRASGSKLAGAGATQPITGRGTVLVPSAGR